MKAEKESKEKSRKGVRIRCPNSFCENYQWIYKGRFLVYATCPSCKKNIRISQNKIESPLQSVCADQAPQIEAVSVGGATAQG